MRLPVLVGTDGSLIADAAVRWAATEAGRRVAPTAEAAGPGPTVETSLAVGAANTRLVAATQEAQLLVVGNRGLGGFGSLLLGSVSSSVVTHAACPTVVVRGETQSQGPVVVGVDEVGASRPAIEAAFAAAQRVGVGVLAVHAYRSPGPLAIREEMASDVMTGEVSVARENYPEEQVRTHLARRSPVHELVEASQGAQVVVTGASGSGGFASHGIGSTSVTVIRHAHCPVLVQR